MSSLKEIGDALGLLVKFGTKKRDISILHCNTEYPTPYEDVNLLAMLSIKEAFDVQVGYSDHTLGIEVSLAAVALGAKVIEKHFTIDRNLPGPDHIVSLEPKELKLMVQSIRNVELAISGNGLKVPSESEKKNIEIARKSIVAKKRIIKGEVFSELNITTKRPGNGINPMFWNEVIGKIAKNDFNEDDLIAL
jgi:N,N'-diacetyllegionaminate synthase